MKLLVTGGAGFIGSNFIRYWLSKHPRDRLINLDKLTYAGNLESLIKIRNNPHYSFIKGDICRPTTVAKAIKGCEVVVHFAAESHVDRSITGPAKFVKTNVLGTQVLLEAALKAKVKKFHHVSTDEVFGSLALHSGLKFSEKSRYQPRSPYSASKAGSDHLARSYYHTYGLPVTITNCSNNFGPYQHPEKFIPLIITNLIQGKKVPIYGDGLNVRDWLYIKDHCRAIDLVLERGRVGETYCVGGLAKGVSNLSLVRLILKLMKKSEESIKFVKDRLGHDRRYAVNFQKIKSELGWQPRNNLKTNLKKTIKWYQDNRWWWETLVA